MAAERESADYHLIISDVAMPGLTGVELVRHMQGLGPVPPVILCSAYTGGINWHMAESISIKTIMVKPIRLASLAKTVREVLDGGQDSGSRIQDSRDRKLATAH